jgi:hypothetical protein
MTGIGRVLRPRGPAVIQQTQIDWVHITHPQRLPSIRRKGLTPLPPKRTYAKRDPFATVGGIYVAHENWVEDIIESLCGTDGWGDRFVRLSLRIPAGTRFCLDEDMIDRVGATTRDDELIAHFPGFGPDGPAWLSRAFDESYVGGRNRSKLNEWSCRLANLLDQTHLDHYFLRLFDPPEIVSVEVGRCP